MNIFKLKNSKQLSKFNSISQPHFSTIGTDTTITNFKHHEHKNREKKLLESSLDATAKFQLTIKWSKNVFSLKDSLTQVTFDESSHNNSFESEEEQRDSNFPILVKVVKGSYGVVKEDSTVSKKHVSNLLLYGKSKAIFILCQSIKFKEKKPYVFGKNISIPITYNGWFEILSEDGKSIRPILSIKELANHALSANNFKKLFHKPKNNISYIVRETIDAYVIPSSSLATMKLKNHSEEQTVSNLKLLDCKLSSIRAGDIIQVIGQVYIAHAASSCSYSSKVGLCKRVKMYKCLVRRKPVSPHHENAKKDLNVTETLYLPEDAHGKYSPVARIENISGVHKLDDLVKKFRFPVMVQLVYGRAPSTTNSGNANTSSSKNSLANNFSPILKLLKIYEEENVLAYPIGRESCLIQIPTRANLNVVTALNYQQLVATSTYFQIMLSECKLLAPEYTDMIYSLPETPPQSVIGADVFNTGIIQSCVKNLIGRTETGRTCLVNRSFQDLKENSQVSLNGKKLQEHLMNMSVEIEGKMCELKADEAEGENSENEDQTFKEIDDLYEYVRTGVLPEYLENEASGVPDKTFFNSSLHKNQSSSSMNKTKTESNRSNEPPKITCKVYRQSHNHNHHHHIHHKNRQKDLHSRSHEEAQFYFSKHNKRVNFSNINQYQHLPPQPVSMNRLNQEPNMSTSQEIFVKKSNSFQQILAGGMSTSYYHPTVNEEHTSTPADEMFFNINQAKQDKDGKDWLETIQRLSFDLKRMDSAKAKLSEENYLESTDNVLKNYKAIPNSEMKINQKMKLGELRNYLSMERLHKIYLNDDFDYHKQKRANIRTGFI